MVARRKGSDSEAIMSSAPGRMFTDLVKGRVRFKGTSSGVDLESDLSSGGA